MCFDLWAVTPGAAHVPARVLQVVLREWQGMGKIVTTRHSEDII